MKNKLVILFAMLLLGISSIQAQDLKQYFKETEGTFVLYDLKNKRFVRHNAKRAKEPLSPFSTFKIPNSLIGLETGVIKNNDDITKWDEKRYPREDSFRPEWNQDQTLRSAFKYSVVWYYRELALQVGNKRMKKYVGLFNYGNQDISSGLNGFWLGKSIKISADEQVDFLRKMNTGKLPISKRSIKLVKEIMVADQTADYTLRARTGGGRVGNKVLGWYVGWLETKNNTYFFALNIDGNTFEEILDKRIQLTKDILTGLGYMPKPQSK